MCLLNEAACIVQHSCSKCGWLGSSGMCGSNKFCGGVGTADCQWKPKEV